MAVYKKSNVNYSNNPYCKTLALPMIADSFQFGTGLKDPVWKKAVYADDFAPYRKETLDKGSELYIFHTTSHLYIGLFFHEDPANIIRQKNEHSSAWSGDMVEIHFGAMEPDPWLYQTGLGISGNRFDSTGNYDKWQAQTFENENGWGAEVRFDLSLFRLTEGGFRFNVCRQALKRAEFSCWSPLQLRFHEVENFGELLMTDYKTALQIKTGKVITADSISRNDYEQTMAKDMIPAQAVLHGPYLSCPETDSVCISWETAGLVPSFIRYQEKGSNQIQICYSNKAHGILKHDTTHFVRLTGLTPGKEYEYEIITLRPVTQQADPSGIRRTFIMPEKDCSNFSFTCTSDIHSDVHYLKKALQVPGADQSTFYALLGDNLSHAAGREALYSGIMDPIVARNNQTPVDKPVVFVRGNHEQLGVYAAEYFQVMRHYSGKSHYSFKLGNTCFIVLDSGNDSPDKAECHYFSNPENEKAQHEFLTELVKTTAYQNAAFRVVMIHIPPTVKKENSIYSRIYENILAPLRTAEIKPDVMLCGHMHQYERVEADKSGYAYSTDPQHTATTETLVNPWPVVVNSSNSALQCSVTDQAITINVYNVLCAAEPVLIETLTFNRKK